MHLDPRSVETRSKNWALCCVPQAILECNLWYDGHVTLLGSVVLTALTTDQWMLLNLRNRPQTSCKIIIIAEFSCSCVIQTPGVSPPPNIKAKRLFWQLATRVEAQEK